MFEFEVIHLPDRGEYNYRNYNYYSQVETVKEFILKELDDCDITNNLKIIANLKQGEKLRVIDKKD